MSNALGHRLLGAIEDGDSAEVRRLIDEEEANPSFLNIYTGVSAVWLASSQGFTNILEILIKKGAPLDVVTERGESALLIAAQEGNCEVVRVLVSGGAELNFENPTNGMTPLIASTMNGHHLCVDLLLNQKENDKCKIDMEKEVRVVNRNSFHQVLSVHKRAIHIAANKNQLKCLSLLIENGADIDSTDSNGCTGKSSCFDLLLF